MKKKETDKGIKVGHVLFASNCAKGITLAKFVKAHSIIKTLTTKQLEEAYSKCGGKK